MTSPNLLRKGLGIHSLEPLVEAAAAYDATLDTEERREDVKSGRDMSTDDERATLFARVLELSRPFGMRGAVAGLAALHACAFALTRPLKADKAKWLQKLRVPFYAPRSQLCVFVCIACTALSMNAGFRILATDANACYDYYVRNGLRRRARCLGVPEIVCPIARLVARFSGVTCGAPAAESSCPLEAAAPSTADRVSKSSAPPLAVGLSELNTSTGSKGIDGSHPTTALATPRSASLRTRSFTLPDDVDAAIGVAAAHDSDDDTAWETEEVIEATDSRGARLVSELHYQNQRSHGHRRKHSSSDYNADQPLNIGTTVQPQNTSDGDLSDTNDTFVLADPPGSDETLNTAAAHTPLLSRAAFIVRFEKHRRTAARLYLGVHAARLIASLMFIKQKLGPASCAAVVHVGLLLRLRRELAYVDCSARASVLPLVAWSSYMLAVGFNIYLTNKHMF